MSRRAFTLVELVVVVGVIGVLVGMLLPAVQAARASAQRAACQNTLKQLGLALHNYESANRRFPPGERHRRTLSWFADILPYVGNDPLYRSAVAAAEAEPDPSAPPHVGFVTPVKAFTCPADGRLGTAHTFERWTAGYGSYLGVHSAAVPGDRVLAPGVFSRSPGVPASAVTDGTSSTVFVVERPPPADFQAGWWYPASPYWGRSGPHVDLVVNGEPRVTISGDGCSVVTPFGPGRLDNPCDRLRVWSLHPSGANFLFGDGGVRYLGYGFAALLPAAATIAGGEVLPAVE